MKKIYLRGEKSKGLYALVDDEDFERLNKIKWHLNMHGYANTSKSTRINGKRHILKPMMHQMVLQVPKGLVCDHINRNRLDNRRSNLRAVSFRNNVVGRPVKGKYMRGVNFNKGSWVMRISYMGNRIEKTCKSEIEAAKLYDKYAKELNGEFAVLNFN